MGLPSLPHIEQSSQVWDEVIPELESSYFMMWKGELCVGRQVVHNLGVTVFFDTEFGERQDE